MLDYKLLALAKLDLSYRDLVKCLAAQELTGVAQALVGNLDRVVSMASFPGRYNALLLPMGQAHLKAELKFRGEPYRTEINGVPLVYAISHDDIQGRKEFGPCEPFNPEELDTIDRGIEGGMTTVEFGLDTLDEAARMSGEYIGKAVEAMLSSMVVGTWTAFETMAGDLWEAAVNAHPRGLAQLAGKSKRDGQEKRDQGKMVQFSLLELYNFDLRTVMGTMQRNMEKVGFTTLDKIRGAYTDAFGNESPGTCTVLDDPALDNLSIARNVIVHKAGVCDREYKDKSEGKTFLPQLEIGDELDLHGQLVADLISPTIACSVRLVQSVDDWLNSRLSAPGDGTGI